MSDTTDIRLAQIAVSMGEVASSDIAGAIEEAQRRRRAGGQQITLARVLVERGAMAQAAAERLETLAREGLLHCTRCGTSTPIRSFPQSRSFACNACGGPLVVRSLPELDSDRLPGPAVTPASGFERTDLVGPSDPGRAPAASDASWRAIRGPGSSASGGGVIGPYRLIQRIGEGGMGAVFLAEHERLDRRVALKVIAAGGAADEEELRRFYNEAKANAKLRHRGIVQIHDVGEADGMPFIAMEYIEGESLAAMLRREGPLALREALEIARQTARALHHAHGEGIVHRDIKPANIMLRRGDGGELQAVITDFGLARNVAAASRITRTGMALGTPAYMSPEQAEGDMSGVGPASDVYSLGVTLYEMVCGRTPFAGGPPLVVLQRILTQDAPPPRSVNERVPQDVETMILTAIEKESDARYPSAEAFAEDIDRFLAYESIRARPPTLGRRVRKLLSRHALISATTPLLLGALVALVAWNLSRPATLRLRVVPESATVTVDGVPTHRGAPELAPGLHEVALSPGTRVIEVSAPDHEPASRAVDLVRQRTLELVVELEREKGLLEVEADPIGTVVTVGGRSHGTPLRALALPTGPHELIAEFPGYERKTLTLELRRERTTRRRITLQRLERWVTNVSDWDSHEVTGDVDGDGVRDVAAIVVAGVQVRSGVDGSLLVQRDGAGLWLVDVDGDGDAELVQIGPNAAAMAELASLRVPGRPWQWRTPMAPQEGWERPGIFDVDGDGLDDIVLARAGRLTALRGRDGARLWEARSPLDAERGVLRALGEGELLLVGLRDIALLSSRDGACRWTRPRAARDELVGRFGDEIRLRGELGTLTLSARTGQTLQEVEASQLGALRVWQCLTIGEGEDRRTLVLLRTPEQSERPRIEARWWPGDGPAIWTLALESPPHSAPDVVAHEGLLLFSIADRAYCVAASSGRVVWTRPLPDRTSCPAVVRDHDGDGEPEVFFGTTEGRVLALCLADGEERYSAWLTVSPIEHIDLIDANRDGFRDVLARATGAALLLSPNRRLLWRRGLRDPIRGGVAMYDVQGDGVSDAIVPVRKPETAVIACDGRDGTQLWTCRGYYHDQIQAVAVVEKTGRAAPEVVLWGRAVERTLGELIRIDAREGRQLDSVMTGSYGYAEIAHADLDGDGVDDLVSAPFHLDPRCLSAISGASLERLWPDLPTGPVFARPTLASVPAGSPPDIFVADILGTVRRVEGRTGRIAWSVGVAPIDARGAGGVRGPVAVDTTVTPPRCWVNGLDGRLHALDARDGRRLWTGAVGTGGTFAGPALAADGTGRVVVGSTAGLRCHAASGETLWQGPAEAFLAGPIVVDLDGDGTCEVVACSRDGRVHAVRLADGATLWEYHIGAEVEGRLGIGDADGDGFLDVVVAAKDRTLTCLSGRFERP